MYKYKASEYIDTNENINMFKYLPSGDEIEHTHDFIEMEYVWCGSGVQVVNGVTHYVERGDLLFFNFGDVHSFRPNGEIGIINCLINPKFLGKELVNSENALDILTLASFKEFETGEIGGFPRIKFLGKDLMEIEAVLEFMLEEFNQKAPGYMTAMKGYMDVLLTKIFRAAKKADTANIYTDLNKIAPKILKFIEENYDKKITLKQLSGESFYNPSYFSRIFKECFGKTLTEYVMEKRISAAVKLMGETDYSIELIGQMAGYNDKKLFYKHFKTLMGTTPSSYRGKIKK